MYGTFDFSAITINPRLLLSLKSILQNECSLIYFFCMDLLIKEDVLKSINNELTNRAVATYVIPK